MALKIFADTNIIIDFLEQRLFGQEDLITLFEMAEDHVIEIYISETVVTNAVYITKSTQILRVLKITKVICIDSNSITAALESNFKDKEDAILYYGALASGMNYFLSRNTKDFLKFSKDKLPVITVKNLIKILSE